MKKLKAGRIIFLFMFLGVVACTKNEKESLDQKYLETKQYESFQDEASEEKKKHQELNRSLEWYLQEFSNCEASQLSIPFELNYEKVGTLIMDASDGCIVESQGQRLKLLGKSLKKSTKVIWVLLERETAYRDQELIAATFQQGTLKSFKTVGAFRKNPSEKITSKIQTTNEGGKIRVVSRTTRNIFYPIEQNNIVTIEYRIETSGNIRKL